MMMILNLNLFLWLFGDWDMSVKVLVDKQPNKHLRMITVMTTVMMMMMMITAMIMMMMMTAVMMMMMMMMWSVKVS